MEIWCMKKILILFFLSLIVCTASFAQPGLVWARQMGGTSHEEGISTAVDASGNVFTTGHFVGTADFDPGPGTLSFTSAGSSDIFVSKLDALGNFVWAKQLGGITNDQGFALAVDPSGNVLTTGSFSGTVDFDPGSGTFNLTAIGLSDIFVSKLDDQGNFVWAKQMGGNPIPSTYDEGRSIAVDPSGNVFTTGIFYAVGDFDPGPGTFNLNSGSNSIPDIFCKQIRCFG